MSRICADPDGEVAAFADRSLAEQRFPYVFLDATYCKARVDRRVVSQAVVHSAALGRGADQDRLHGLTQAELDFLRDVLARIPKVSAEMVAAAIRTIFAQPDTQHVHDQLDVIAGMLGRQFPKVETMLREAEPDLLAFTEFPVAHWKKIWSTNALAEGPRAGRCAAGHCRRVV